MYLEKSAEFDYAFHTFNLFAAELALAGCFHRLPFM